jgi:hypothetical protein
LEYAFGSRGNKRKKSLQMKQYKHNFCNANVEKIGEGESLSSCKHTLTAAAAFAAAALASI